MDSSSFTQEGTLCSLWRKEEIQNIFDQHCVFRHPLGWWTSNPNKSSPTFLLPHREIKISAASPLPGQKLVLTYNSKPTNGPLDVQMMITRGIKIQHHITIIREGCKEEEKTKKVWSFTKPGFFFAIFPNKLRKLGSGIEYPM